MTDVCDLELVLFCLSKDSPVLTFEGLFWLGTDSTVDDVALEEVLVSSFELTCT